MNPKSILAGEFVLAIAFTSWFAIKNQYAPWPPTVVKICASFGIFGIVAMAAPEIAAALAGGFLLAGFLKIYQEGLSNYYGGVPGVGNQTSSADAVYEALNWKPTS